MIGDDTLNVLQTVLDVVCGDAAAGPASLDSEDSGEYHSLASTVISTNLAELQAKLRQTEAELDVVSMESQRLQERLMLREQEEDAVEHIRLLNAQTAEQLERQRARSEAAARRSDRTAAANADLEHKVANKDFLIRTLAEAVRGGAEPPSAAVVRALRNATYKPSYMRGTDFNLDSLCRFIETGEGAVTGRKPDAAIAAAKLVSLTLLSLPA